MNGPTREEVSAAYAVVVRDREIRQQRWRDERDAEEAKAEAERKKRVVEWTQALAEALVGRTIQGVMTDGGGGENSSEWRALQVFLNDGTSVMLSAVFYDEDGWDREAILRVDKVDKP